MRRLLVLLMIALSITLISCKKEQKYQITLDYQNGSSSLKYETTGNLGLETPLREGYLFLGWYDGDHLYTEDVTTKDLNLRAEWLKIGVSYAVFFDPRLGEMPIYIPHKYLTGSTTLLPTPTKKHHEFMGWYLDEDCHDGPYQQIEKTFSGTKTFYAKWVDVASYKQITYFLDGGSLPEEALTKYIPGETYELDAAKKDGFFFRGFYYNPEFIGSPIKRITNDDQDDITLYAKYEEALLINAKISIYGDSISTFYQYIPDNYPAYYPTPYVNVESINDTWWYNAITKIKSTFCQNASWSGSRVSGGGESDGVNIERIKALENLTIGEPDIIIIYLGINDCSRGADNPEFENAYRTMLKRIQNEFRASQLVLCTLANSTFVNSDCYETRDEFCESIRNLASEFSCLLVDIDQIITADNKYLYMANNLHPNKEGMLAISDEVVKVLRKFYLGH